MGAGVAVGALLLTLSQALRGARDLSVIDFRAALALAGALSALSVFSYLSLAPDAGDEISGHGRSAKPA
jgi:hypothetical protein